MKKLTVKEQKLVNAKAKGKTHLEAAAAAQYLPNANNNTKQVEVARTLNKPHVKHALDTALAKHNITLDRALAPISKALDAKKQNEFTGEITEDLATQLKGSDRALKLMGIGQENNTQNNFIQVIKEQTNKYV